MKKKLNKIAALSLGSGHGHHGICGSSADGCTGCERCTSIITKTDVTNMKPGDKVHVECCLSQMET